MRLKPVVVLFSFVAGLWAQITMQPYHWSMRYVDFLKQSGNLKSLNLINRPVDRLALSQMLKQMENSPTEPVIHQMYGILQKELNNEAILNTSAPKPVLVTGMNGFLNYNNQDSINSRYNFQFNPYFIFSFSKNLLLYANLKLFKNAPPDYIGKTFRGLHAYMEQAYLSYTTRLAEFKIGRDFLQFGPGRTGQLLFSDHSRTFDQYFCKIKAPFLSFMFFGINLDKRRSNSLSDNPLKIANRYINGHRLSFHFKDTYYLGFSEVVLYGGPGRTWELSFINPLNFYYASTSNGPHMDANFLYNIDWDFYLPYNTNLYGELLIDDYQVDKKEPGDLEPNEIGLLCGINWQPGFIRHTRLNVEYVQIRNRTYNAPLLDWEKYIHRNEVIGYYLGNDLKLWYGMVEKWWNARLQTKISLTYLRKGEGDVLGPFNTDYMNYTVEQGYDEPFPWGIVESNLQIGLEGFYYINQWANISLLLYNDHITNYRHIQGKKKNQLSIRLNFSFQASKLFH